MRGRARAANMSTRHHVKTLATTSSSRPNPKTQAAREVLAHPRAAFHRYPCGLHGGAIAMIGYGDLGLLQRRS
jgi:hypothetical protein